ncbi:MAG: alpha-L-fucosidase [Acidimicrobiales bacterium]|nr:alpha-L-fucosidase [Acidimicrobiales bacterium]
MDAALKRRLRAVPAWWADAKLGIFVHWTPASVPGFAPTTSDIGDLVMSGRDDALADVPYSEWYENSLRFPSSAASAFHRERYGDRPYAAFADDFVAGLDGWDPAAWARSFAATGARYVVLVTKHHDGWCLWPSAVVNPRRPGWFSRRDIVGELADAVRAEGMRFGVYYSGGLDWTFEPWPIGTAADAIAAAPTGDYLDYAEAQVLELIERYRPSVLWNDISWPTPQKRLDAMFGRYFDAVPDGVVNDRWITKPRGLPSAKRAPVRALVNRGSVWAMRRSGGLVPPAPRFYQHRTPEYVVFDHIQRTPWECVRGMDKGFGFNRTSTEADFLTRDDLLRSLADIVAKGGNLMLNVGPRGEDAQIPDEQATRLEWLAGWMARSATALQDTRPWIRSDDRTSDGWEVRYTATGDRVWALCWRDDRSGGSDGSALATITLPFTAGPTTTTSTVDGRPLAFVDTGTGLRVELPADRTPSMVAVAVDRAQVIGDPA